MVSYMILLPLYGDFGRVSTLILLYITVDEVLAIFIDNDTRIKGVQLGNHEIKQRLFWLAPPFFLRDVTFLIRIKAILNYKKLLAKKYTFQKANPYRLGDIIKQLIKQDKWYGHNFP